MDETANELLQMFVDEGSLPSSEGDPTGVFLARPMLWKDLRPFPPTGLDDARTCSIAYVNTTVRHHRARGSDRSFDDRGVARVEG